MKLGLCRVFVLLAFSVLQVHNFIPHHHHHPIDSHPALVSEEDEGHHHHHFPFAALHIDEFFCSNIYTVQGSIAHDVFTACDPFLGNGTSINVQQIFETGYLRGHPPSPPFLSAFSFRGPPTV